MNRLEQRYKEQVVPALMKQFQYSSIMQAPKIEKVVINVGVGDAIANPKAMEEVVAEITQICGQKPIVTKAKKSIANFKLREGMAIGCKVTLRGERMYEFLDKLMNISLPRVRDFRGVSKTAFDGRGNYTLGVKEQIIFPAFPSRSGSAAPTACRGSLKRCPQKDQRQRSYELPCSCVHNLSRQNSERSRPLRPSQYR